MDFENERSEEIEEVAEPLEETEVEESEEEQEVADPASEEETGKTDRDSAFAQMRREKEELERRLAEVEAQRDEYDEALGMWFEGDNKIAQARAHFNDTSVEVEEEKMSASKLEKQNQALNDELTQLRYEKKKAEDLAEIKAAFPDASINDVEELGEKFFQYRTMDIDAVTAYEALNMKKSKPPKSMGKVKTAPPQKDTFTQEEVARMSEDEVKANFEKIRKSMSKWT